MGNHKYGEARCENEYLVSAIKKERQKRKKIGRIVQGISLLVWLRAVWFPHLPVTDADESGQIPRELCRSAEPMLSTLHWNTHTSDNVKTRTPLTFVTAPNAQWSAFNLGFILVCVRPWTDELRAVYDGQRVTFGSFPQATNYNIYVCGAARKCHFNIISNIAGCEITTNVAI